MIYNGARGHHCRRGSAQLYMLQHSATSCNDTAGPVPCLQELHKLLQRILDKLRLHFTLTPTQTNATAGRRLLIGALGAPPTRRPTVPPRDAEGCVRVCVRGLVRVRVCVRACACVRESAHAGVRARGCACARVCVRAGVCVRAPEGRARIGTYLCRVVGGLTESPRSPRRVCLFVPACVSRCYLCRVVAALGRLVLLLPLAVELLDVHQRVVNLRARPVCAGVRAVGPSAGG
jgi:hypothetical protein